MIAMLAIQYKLADGDMSLAVPLPHPHPMLRVYAAFQRKPSNTLMKNAIAETQKEFESASYKTPEYLAWFRTFKREFTKFLQERGMTGIDFGKPNHFDMHGFFKDGGKDQIWYFSISDLRGFKDNMLIRTAQHYKDFTGGQNQYLSLASEDAFTADFEVQVQGLT